MKNREKKRGNNKLRVKHPLRYVAIALCIALFVLINMAIIFRFSAESQEESGDRSATIAALVLRFTHPDYDQLSTVEKTLALESVHRLVRKTAHFLEYALLGFLSASLMLFVRRYMYRRKIEAWKTWFYPAEFCFLYAVSDEIHQVYSERGPSAVDVLIDTVGAFCGIVLIQLIVLAIRKLRGRRAKKRLASAGSEGSDSVMASTEAETASDRDGTEGTTSSEAETLDGPVPSDREGEETTCNLPPTD